MAALGGSTIAPPLDGESEPKFTRRVLAPVVRQVLDQIPGLHLQLRGDGGDEQSIPSSILGVEFFPDLAVSIGRQHVWAAEVKFLKPHSRQNSIATAVGQATVYRRRYEMVSIFFLDTSPGTHEPREDVQSFSTAVGLHTVFAYLVGNEVCVVNGNY